MELKRKVKERRLKQMEWTNENERGNKKEGREKKKKGKQKHLRTNENERGKVWKRK